MTLCGFCKSDDSHVLYGTDDIFGNAYEMNACHSCHATFLSPYPDAERLAQAYDESYYGQGDEKFNEGLIEKVLDYFRNCRAKRVARFIKHKGRNPDSYPDHYFDAITMFHVFEHLTDPIGYLNTIQRILKPEGILYLSFPNIGSLQSRMFRGDWLHLDPPRHLFFFEPNQFKVKMKEFGFEVINEKYFNPEYNPFGTVQSILNKICSKRELLYEALKHNEGYVNEVPAWKIHLQKIFAIVIAPLFILTDVSITSKENKIHTSAEE